MRTLTGAQQQTLKYRRQRKKIEKRKRKGTVKVRCYDCLNNVDLIALYRDHHYCNVKKIWIPDGKYRRRRKCGKFKPLPWPRKEEVQPAMVTANKYEPRETKPVERSKLSRWRDWEHWRGFFFLPGFLGRKLRQITKYASKVTIVH